MASKRFALVNQARCVACGACEGVCPREAISVFRGMYATVLEACCIGCGKCAESCPQHTITIRNRKAVIDYTNCIRCYCCHEMCPKHVIDIRRLSLFRH